MDKVSVVSVGCASIDAQHSLLATLVENVVLALQGGAGNAAYHDEILGFRAALLAHFAAEQDHLSAAGYDQLDAHIHKHQQVIQRLDMAITALDHVDSATARFAIVTEIEDAIYLHELMDDADYAGCLGDGHVATDWDDSLLIGVDWVDEQHRQLFVLLNVFRLHAIREDWKMCRFLLNRLLNRVKTHFDNEDSFLKTQGSAAFPHRRHHFEALLALEAQLENTEDEALRSIDGFIFQLLRNHILDEDKRDLARR